MWTPAARAELVRETLPYATCLSDAEWAVLAPLLPAPARTGRPWLWSQRAVLDGILYVLRTGCAWRHLPLDFPPWGTVYRWFLRWAEAGVFERLAHALTLADRERVGREAGPTGAILDAQAARSGGVGVKGVRGYDAAKRVVGRKRHALTDTDGRLLMAAVSPADLHDSHGGVALLRASRQLWPFLAHCFADRAYRGERVGTSTTITVEIVEPEDGQTGFAVQPRRWVIERTLGWISRCRRLARDHEATVSSALAFFVLAAAMVLVRRLARAL
ncbi:IS5 family transposase [Methylobacterium frigidaeris]|uniref:IS5 family transposase ISMdi17 n=1 Tax=Methylobacterium frigidaeris TaxID=2038277 RepID=A0AA37HGS4_9HYPH|nr:IS5 family transposase [Methylobacterium frigidaeris]PIK73227.1 IS5/IS1182 family transposase [Methylobacterium frigidaeris]GJD65776.1 IS5 family transposase ISMdi17 [Methylobacterium frigidaeris]